VALKSSPHQVSVALVRCEHCTTTSLVPALAYPPSSIGTRRISSIPYHPLVPTYRGTSRAQSLTVGGWKEKQRWARYVDPLGLGQVTAAVGTFRRPLRRDRSLGGPSASPKSIARSLSYLYSPISELRGGRDGLDVAVCRMRKGCSVPFIPDCCFTYSRLLWFALSSFL
jgi:hypothetical protein